MHEDEQQRAWSCRLAQTVRRAMGRRYKVAEQFVVKCWQSQLSCVTRVTVTSTTNLKIEFDPAFQPRQRSAKDSAPYPFSTHTFPKRPRKHRRTPSFTSIARRQNTSLFNIINSASLSSTSTSSVLVCHVWTDLGLTHLGMAQPSEEHLSHPLY